MFVLLLSSAVVMAGELSEACEEAALVVWARRSEPAAPLELREILRGEAPGPTWVEDGPVLDGPAWALWLLDGPPDAARSLTAPLEVPDEEALAELSWCWAQESCASGLDEAPDLEEPDAPCAGTSGLATGQLDPARSSDSTPHPPPTERHSGPPLTPSSATAPAATLPAAAGEAAPPRSADSSGRKPAEVVLQWWHDEAGSESEASRGADPPEIDADGDGYPASADCDDHDASVHPDAREQCDGRDQDCDGEIDENAQQARQWVPTEGAGRAVWACSAPAGFTTPAER